MEIGAASKFGQKLAHTDKNVRDKALKSLTMYLLNKKEWTDLDLDKIWKALFYCMWMSDKMKIQQELAGNLSKLVHKFPTKDLSIRFVHSFFKTIHREWHGIDGLRIDKFYSLIRQFVHQSFLLLEEPQSTWNIELTEKLATILSSEILSKLPNGLRLHICDLYLKELYEAVGNAIPNNCFVMLIEPFFTLLGSECDKTVTKRVRDLVFMPMLKTYFFKENKPTPSTSSTANDTDEEDSNDQVFENVYLASIQHRIFEIAAADDTPERNRSVLYEIYGLYYAVTKIDSSKVDIKEDMALKLKQFIKEQSKTSSESSASDSKKAINTAIKRTAEGAEIVNDDKKKKKLKKNKKDNDNDNDNSSSSSKKAIESTPVKELNDAMKVDAKAEKAKKSPEKSVKKQTNDVKTPANKEAKPAVDLKKHRPVKKSAEDAKKPASKAKPVGTKAEAKSNKKSNPASKSASAATPFPRCSSCGGFGKGLLVGSKTMCGHCERVSKKQKVATKKRKAEPSSVDVKAVEETTSSNSKKVTFGKNKALPYQLSIKRMKASVGKDFANCLNSSNSDIKGLLKVKSSENEIKNIKKHLKSNVTTNTISNTNSTKLKKRAKASDFF